MLTSPRITRVRAISASERSQWTGLLCETVAGGASVGFLAPLEAATAARYWASAIEDVVAGSRVLLALRRGDRLVATVQLALPWQPNAAHRAEVQKLIVHPAERRRGHARRLLAAIEERAAALGRTLLVLDTQRDDPAELLYRAAGYTYVGSIADYAAGADGVLRANAIYCKRLTETVSA